MFDKEILEYENQLLHDEVAFEQACFEQSLNLRRIQNKLILENAVMESAEVTDLYLVEAKESGEKKQGLLTRLINTIRNFIGKILKKITGGKIDITTDKKVPEDPYKLMKYGRELMNKAKTALKSTNGTKVAIGAGIGAVAAGGFMIKKGMAGNTLKDITSYLKETDHILEVSRDIVSGAVVGDVEAAQKYISEYGKINQRLGKVVAALKAGERVSGATAENPYAGKDDGLVRYNGLTTEKLNKLLDDTQKELDDIAAGNTFRRRLARARSASKDKSKFNLGYQEQLKVEIANYKKYLEEDKETLQNLLRDQGKRQAHADFVMLHPRMKD